MSDDRVIEPLANPWEKSVHPRILPRQQLIWPCLSISATRGGTRVDVRRERTGIRRIYTQKTATRLAMFANRNWRL